MADNKNLNNNPIVAYIILFIFFAIVISFIVFAFMHPDKIKSGNRYSKPVPLFSINI